MTTNSAVLIPLFPNQMNAIDLYRDLDAKNIIFDDDDDKEEMLEMAAEDAQVEQIAVLVGNIITNAINQCGFDSPYDFSVCKEYAFIVEAVKSMILKYQDREHSLQRIASGTIKIIENEDNFEYEYIEPKFGSSVEELQKD